MSDVYRECACGARFYGSTANARKLALYRHLSKNPGHERNPPEVGR